MSNAAEYVKEATEWADRLVLAESRGPGDYLEAMRRVARRAGVTFHEFWKLRYRKPKTIDVEKWAAIGSYYADEHRRKYREERPMARTQLGRALLGTSDWLAGQEVGAVNNDH